MDGLLKADKVFCIGLNKTGTTSLESALQELGYSMGSQAAGEILLRQYLTRNFGPIIEFCKTADAFQDIPFGLPYTFVLLDHFFPNANFILSIRDSPDQWYLSDVSFQKKFFNIDVEPTAEMLQSCEYRYKGFMWDSQWGVMSLPQNDIFNREKRLNFYNRYNECVYGLFPGETQLFANQPCGSNELFGHVFVFTEDTG